MALTRPLLSQLNTNIIAFSDNMMVINAGNVANRDIGTVYDRSQGSVSNVAIVWQESRQAFTFAYTSSSGLTNANLTLTSNANVVAGNVFSGTSTVTGNITGGNVNATSNVRATGDVFGKELWSTQSSGDEGGQLNMGIPVTNTSLTGQVTIDVYQNKLRFFQGDNARGAYIDLTQAATSVGTNLLAGGGGGTPGGANTYVQFNDGGLFGGNINFTYDKGFNTVTTGTFAATLNGLGQNFKVGDDAWIGDINLSNTIGIKGQQDSTQCYIVFGTTNTQTLGRSGAGALTYQGGFTAQGGLQNTPIGNATPSTAIFTTVGSSGNTTVSALTVNANATIGTTLRVSGGLQNTPIGNATPSTALFTTVSATGNITAAALTSNGSITAITSLSALGGLQNTPIGNATPSTAIFTTVGSSGNTTVSALTVNANATIGTTLGVTGNISGSGITLTGSLAARGPGDFDGGLQSTPIGNAAPSTALFTTIGSSGNATVSALTVNATATIGTTLGVTGNINGSSITLTGSLRATGPGDFDGGLQSTPIGNAAASTGQFTTIGATGTFTGTTINAAAIGNTGATLTGTIQTAAQTNITSVGNIAAAGVTSSARVAPNANATVDLGAVGLRWNNVYGVTFSGVSTTAKYADLAEIYIADDNYPPGTVVVFGGQKEITVTSTAHDTRVAGVISTNPAYLMNSEVQGLPVALTGRVPCLVQGPINKGEVLVTGLKPGTAQKINPARFQPGCVIGKSIENIPDDELKLIEIVVGRF